MHFYFMYFAGSNLNTTREDERPPAPVGARPVDSLRGKKVMFHWLALTGPFSLRLIGLFELQGSHLLARA